MNSELHRIRTKVGIEVKLGVKKIEWGKSVLNVRFTNSEIGT